MRQRDEWFSRGRLVRGKPVAELRRRAYQAKLRMRAERAAALAALSANASSSVYSGFWTPLGPVPLASDATGIGIQDYGPVAGRATAVAIDPADPTGNTIYIGGAQSGVWKSTNAASATATSVTWAPLTDDQPTLSIGALAIQPGNGDSTRTVILAATGEANNSMDSYFGLGILRSEDAGNSWSLISTANGDALSFSGLGGTRMAFSTSTPNTVVAAMATSSEGAIAGALTANTKRGLYTSLDAGRSWTYNALLDSGVATDATSATSVVYNSGQFFAAVRYHGFYSSPDGVNWTWLPVQPGGGMLSAGACPPISTSNGQACPIYRAEITAVPGRNEMYVWFVYFSATGDPVDGGIWQSLNGGTSWTPISDTGITNCGDSNGCGVEQGSYNLELLAVPNVSGTDLYAGSINLYKCAINPQNPSCAASPFVDLTHVYGCDPIAAPAHVHPDQHALAYTLPESGTDAGNALMFFANDGGIYRALNAYAGLTTASCAGTNQFDDLNQNLGSMTQFVTFSQHPTDPNTMLGGTQDNGSPATNRATTSLSWGNVLGGDGGYNAIDPNAPANFFATNPDIPPGGLAIQLCPSGVNCTDSTFAPVVLSSALGGDDGAFYFPFILDSQSTTTMLVGTCRIWRGPRAGGSFVALSPNFDTFGSGACYGNEVNQVRSVAAGGATDTNGSAVIYATTSGPGPLDGPLNSPAGGHVWVTTNATAGPSSFANVSGNGPQGSVNPNQFPISAVAIDLSDPSGATAYITVMGFTGGAGHVWKTKNAGLSWADFTANLPDSPVNAVVIDPTSAQVYVGTDVGVFTSSTFNPQWTEVGPAPSAAQTGFLPDVAVTALALFNASGQKLLRASTYGRGVWQFNLNATPDYQLTISNSPLTGFSANAVFNGTATALGGYADSVSMGCVAGATPPPSTCTATPAVLTPTSNTPFTVLTAGAVGDYTFNLQGVGADPLQTTHTIPLTLHIVGLGITAASPASVSVARGSTSPPVSFQVTAAGSFNQSVTVSCSLSIANAACSFTPGSTVSPTSSNPVNLTVAVTVPSGTASGIYPVTIQASTSAGPAAITTQFTLQVTANPDFTLTSSNPFPEVNAGSTGTRGAISLASLDGFTGTVSLSCTTTAGSGTCGISPSSVSSYPATTNLTINANGLPAGSYSASVTGTSGALTHSITIPFNVGDYTISGTPTLSSAPGAQVAAHLTLTSSSGYAGKINVSCDASALPSATCVISPSNSINLSSGATANLTATINIPNNVSSGEYNIKVNTQDTSGTPGHAVAVALTVSQDFAVTSSTASLTVTAGQTSGPYNLTIQPVGGSFNAPVSLSCSGLPASAQCSFNPPSAQTPGSSAMDVIMDISTTAGSNDHAHAGGAPRLSLWLLLPGLALICAFSCSENFSHRSTLRPVGVIFLLMSAIILLSCGGASTGGGGGGGTCSAAPNLPTGLASSAPTSTSAALNWKPSSATAGCSVSYVISETSPASQQVGTTTSTTYNVTGLAPATQYSFAVAASDSAGTSAESTPVSITTTSTGGTPKGSYTITVKGTSSGTAADPGQSTEVTLVVQ